MPYKVEGVSRETLAGYWLEVSHLLKPALEQDDDEISMSQLFDQIDHGSAMLWIVRDKEIDGALVITLKPSSLMVWLMGGKDFDKWHYVVEEHLIRYAQEHGRAKIMANVRPGLGKKLKNWKRTQETVVLDGWQEQPERARHDATDVAA